MARRNRRNRQRQRDANPIANPPIRLLPAPVLARSGRLIEIEDRRKYQPSFHSPPRSLSRVARVLNTVPRTRTYRSRRPTALGAAFSHPKTVLTCIRRKMRREVLFATGRSGSNPGRRRRNRNSYFRC